MALKILYFTAANVPTAPELAEISALKAAVAQQYELQVRSGASTASPNYGSGIEACDFKAGTPPASYSAVPAITIDDIDPAIADGETVVVENSAGSVSLNATAEVVDGVLDHVALAATVALVSSGAQVTGVTGTGTRATITVAGGVITAIALDTP